MSPHCVLEGVNRGGIGSHLTTPHLGGGASPTFTVIPTETYQDTGQCLGCWLEAVSFSAILATLTCSWSHSRRPSSLPCPL